ncbi:hypothetical protein EDB19DRAFT_1892662 [Suillus lakei]|nr:hypothetical protein EDB19DRAFT_1892662 [Suillus lakei]
MSCNPPETTQPTYDPHEAGFFQGFTDDLDAFEAGNSGSVQFSLAVNPWYPFDGPGEWSLAKFLVKNLTQTQIDQFLKLEWFKTQEQPAFKLKDELFFYLDLLPGHGPKWQCTEFRLKGYESEQPIYLIWRDALEVVKQLFVNPVYANHMCYDPHMVYNGTEREIREFWTTDDAWAMQDQLPPGATIVPIIMASDKTPVTRHTGGLEMHPLFLTIGNIQSNVRMKATSHTWHCVAFMPTPTFLVGSNYQMLLQSQLWHRCMDFVSTNLKVAARIGEFMANPSAQWYTYARIRDLCDKIDPWNLHPFVNEAKKLHLSGIHLQYWRNWRFANPAKFLTPEVLHALHKFFFDHVLKWIKEVMDLELDMCFRSQHKRIGIHHFGSGVSHVKQMTGREHRDIQRTIVPTLWGAAPPDFLRAVHAMINFIYLAQNPIHTAMSINAMTSVLSEFHAFKGAILVAEARRGKGGVKDDFDIPKLKLMQNFACAVFNVGSLMQWSADVSERLLITHCKHLFEKTSRQKDFVKQIARILDRKEAIRLFNLYTLLSSSSTAASSQSTHDPLINAVITEDDEITATETDLALTWISCINPEAQRRLHGPQPVHNNFLKGIVSDNVKVTFNVTLNPNHKCLTVPDLQLLYGISDFLEIFGASLIMSGHADLYAQLCQLVFNIWFKFCIQLHSTFHDCTIMPSQVVQAEPPSEQFPHGHCDVVLVGPFVAQVCAVFQPTTKKYLSLEVPAFLNQVFMLVQPFTFIGDDPEPLTRMWRVWRSRNINPSLPRYGERLAIIVPLTDITHAAELIPIYEGPLSKDVQSNMSLELFDEFFLNNFVDKEMYHALAIALDG